ncbi:LPXTG cell wall anchor domain-containing protein [Bacillus sp. SM-B1]|nr:LPXTG cell wall anchor domain-containing protein [Bacillus sp. SM-B1]
MESSSGGDNKPVTPPNKEENQGNETAGKQSKEGNDKQVNKPQDDRNADKHLPNTGHKEDPTQTVGIVLLLAGLLSILSTKRKKHYK